ncbi:MAG TPA: glycine cleavage system protein GcvH [Tepidisphaeraceae bacterium]|jgi:glycine cleavage system H protein|nr:glycine cleavage system protein GcvH [Tepidisphaeraceae bacterium]
MPETPPTYRYLQSHEWHNLQGDSVTIGITQFAADELTDVTYLDLPKVGTKVKANQRFGEIESVKTTSDLISGVSGTVTAVNDALAKTPGLVNSDPYAGGWMIKIKADDPAEVGKLLSAEDYLKKTGH